MSSVKRKPFAANYLGPYVIGKRVSAVNYIIKTPERRRKTQLCHSNRLKGYVEQAKGKPIMTVLEANRNDKEDYSEERTWIGEDRPLKLDNSTILNNLGGKFKHLPAKERGELIALMQRYKELFSDVPRSTKLINQDVDVSDTKPIKQHPYRLNSKKLKIIR